MTSSKKRTKQEEKTSQKPEPELGRESEPKVWLKPGDPPRTLREILAATQARVAIDRKIRGRPQTWREVFARARQWRAQDLHQGEANQKPDNGSQTSLEGWEKAKKEYCAEMEAKGVPATLRGMREKRKRDVLMELKRDGYHFEKGTWLVDDDPSEAELKRSGEGKAEGDAPSQQLLREELHKTRGSSANLASKSGRTEPDTQANARAAQDDWQLHLDDLAKEIEVARARDATRRRQGKPAREVEILEYDMEYSIAQAFLDRYLNETRKELLDSGNQISDKAEYQSWSERTARFLGNVSNYAWDATLAKARTVLPTVLAPPGHVSLFRRIGRLLSFCIAFPSGLVIVGIASVMRKIL